MSQAVDTRRREEALEIACGLFVRFGYRKTSMDEIARSVGVSRQGLYLWFPSKETLFREMIEHLTGRMRGQVETALADTSRPLGARLVDAFDAYAGAHIQAGMNAGAMDELLATAVRLFGESVRDFEREFLGRLVSVLEGHTRDGDSPDDTAEVLYAVSAGTKYRVGSREEYRGRMRTAVRVVGLD